MNTEMIGGRKPLPVPLDENDEKLLREVVASPIWSLAQTRRAEAVLGIAGGERQCQLAQEIGYSVASIRRSCRRFQQEGVAGLLTEETAHRTAPEPGQTRRIGHLTAAPEAPQGQVRVWDGGPAGAAEQSTGSLDSPGVQFLEPLLNEPRGVCQAQILAPKSLAVQE